MSKNSKALITPYTSKNFQIVKIDDLTPYKNNARKHPPAQIDKIAESIMVFGTMSPPLVDKKNRIIAGHARVEAAKKIGLKLIPVIRVEHLSEAQIRAYIIADNKLAESAAWDESLLKIELGWLVQADLKCEIDFDPRITGFVTAEIDNILDTPNAESSAVDDLSDVQPSDNAVSSSGDIWHLGEHRILCGNSLVKENYTDLLKGQKARILCTDPPYNVRIQGHVSGKGKNKHREFASASGEMNSTEFTSFLAQFLSHSISVLVNGGVVYAFMDWRHDRELQSAARKCDLHQINLCVWDKGSGGMGSFYRSQHELVFVYKHGKLPHVNNVMLGRDGRNRTNVWHHPSANMERRGRDALKNHPTPKPVPLIMDIIKDSTKIGDMVLDPFLGSGSTLLAAEKTLRRCVGIEIDPLYVDVTIRRWQELTGKDAVNARTKRTFREHEDLGGGDSKVRERVRVREKAEAA